MQQQSESRELIHVPKASEEKMLRRLESKIGLRYVAPSFRARTFMVGEGGKTFEVMKWRPGYGVTPAHDVRSFFEKKGYGGNTAAFLAWILHHNPEGWFSTIPPDEKLFRVRTLSMTEFYFRSDADSGLYLSADPYKPWGAEWCFLGFREVA